MQQKENIFQKLKRKWKEMDREEKAILITAGCSSFFGSIVTGAIDRHEEKKRMDQMHIQMDSDAKFMYQMGLKDGQTKAYYTLLTKPDVAFKKMGMEPIKF